MSDEQNPWGDAVDQNAMELASGDASDVTLRAGAEGDETTDVRFSRILLACHSPVFRTMLFGSMSESRDDAPVRVAYSLEVVQRLLAYCATADDACDPETAIELHNAADFYQIGGLAKHVAEFIVSSLDANTATTLFDSAMAHEQEELAATCREYVEKHATRALSGELVCRLSQDAFLVLVQSEALRMSEIELFEAVVRWGEALVGRAIRTDEIELSDGKKLKARVAPLIEHVRFGLMSGEDLAAKVMPTELVDIAVTHDAFAAQFLKVNPTQGINVMVRGGAGAGTCVKTLAGHTQSVRSVCEVGGMLASGSNDNTVKLWDVGTGTCVKTLAGHTDSVYSVCEVGGMLASGSEDRTVKLWPMTNDQRTM